MEDGAHGFRGRGDLDQDELRLLGIASSPAYVREPEGSGVLERVIRTFK
jgi:hypothetical protein